jgi:hypothetical protein
MATQTDFAFIPVTITAGATAGSIYDIIVAGGVTPVGGCTALRVVFGADTYWGNVSTVTQATGALVASGVIITDTATGAGGNVIPIAQMFIFKQAAGDATGTIYARFTP